MPPPGAHPGPLGVITQEAVFPFRRGACGPGCSPRRVFVTPFPALPGSSWSQTQSSLG